MSLTVGSLFSGIGALDLGLERAGMHIAWQVEIDEYARQVLEKHWPDVARFRDVRECGAHNLERVDLICGGFPCQPHSLAGKRLASADERDLWGQFARIIRELAPRWVLAENVPGIRSSEAGRFFGRILGDLAALGYDAEWDCLPASAVGAPHIRDRLFIVAYPHRQRLGALSLWPQCFAQALPSQAGWWQSEGGATTRRGANGGIWLVPDGGVDGMAYGLAEWMDRIRCLGNAVVPQVAEHIGRLIIAAEEADRDY